VDLATRGAGYWIAEVFVRKVVGERCAVCDLHPARGRPPEGCVGNGKRVVCKVLMKSVRSLGVLGGFM
jgi:hypothetical protein